MKILCVSGDGSITDLAYRLQLEGHQVRICIEEKKHRNAYKGMLRQVRDWKKQLQWVGKKDGMILFDSTGYGKIQEELRNQGYSVVGGSAGGDRCEDDRTYGQEVFWASGLKMISSNTFTSLSGAINFVRKNPGYWVIKQNGHASKTFNYVGQDADGRDVISVLKSYKRTLRKSELKSIELQQRIFGVEIAVGRYFNGHDWVGPACVNIEHKNLCDGDLGPKTFEMGNLMWMDYHPESNKLYEETLHRISSFLKDKKFHGYVDINCIVNAKGAYPLEITARFGFPTVHLQQMLCPGEWGKFLKSVADGKQYVFRPHKERKYGVITLLATPPFPYGENLPSLKNLNLNISFDSSITSEETRHIHFEEVSQKKSGEYYISGATGFVLHISAVGATVEVARQKMYSLARKIHVPKAFYRTDIGEKFLESDRKQLKQWGYIK